MNQSFLAGCILLTGCGRVGFAESGDSSVPDASARCGPWSDPVHQTSLGSQDRFDWGAEINADATEIAFDSDRGGSQDLYVASRAARTAPWSGIAKIDALSTAGFDADQTRTADDLEVFFTSDRVGARFCLYTERRATAAAAWTSAGIMRLDALCAADTVGGAWISDDGLRLYYTSALDQTSMGFLRVSVRSTRDDDFAAGVLVPGLASGSMKGFPTLSADELEIWWQQGAPSRLFTAARRSITDAFGVPEAVMPSTNLHDDGDASISGDGQTFEFSSTRLGGDWEYFEMTRECP